MKNRNKIYVSSEDDNHFSTDGAGAVAGTGDENNMEKTFDENRSIHSLESSAVKYPKQNLRDQFIEDDLTVSTMNSKLIEENKIKNKEENEEGGGREEEEEFKNTIDFPSLYNSYKDEDILNSKPTQKILLPPIFKGNICH
jgi:hypothetical protein